MRESSPAKDRPCGLASQARHDSQTRPTSRAKTEGRQDRSPRDAGHRRLRDGAHCCHIVAGVKAPERAKLDIFERVNSGEPLTRQQMRNCLYNGNATRWLDATKSKPFLRGHRRIIRSQKMRDHEAINRFCAFSEGASSGPTFSVTPIASLPRLALYSDHIRRTCSTAAWRCVGGEITN